MATMMKCGHVAQGKHMQTGVPVCVICFGISPGASVPVEAPDLTGRTAHCAQCGSTTDSSIDLPFFYHQPDRAMDDYYDGCRGWD